MRSQKEISKSAERTLYFFGNLRPMLIRPLIPLPQVFKCTRKLYHRNWRRLTQLRSSSIFTRFNNALILHIKYCSRKTWDLSSPAEFASGNEFVYNVGVVRGVAVALNFDGDYGEIRCMASHRQEDWRLFRTNFSASMEGVRDIDQTLLAGALIIVHSYTRCGNLM